MNNIELKNFGGVVPRIGDRLLPINNATIAQNCKLGSGELRPFRNPRPDTAVLKDGLLNTIYSISGIWMSWNADVDVVRGFIPGDTSGRIYYSGEGKPKVTNVALATGSLPYPSTAYDLGITPPVAAPVLVLGVGGVGVASLRYYVYTFLTAFEEESVPSPVSVGVNAKDGQPVTVSGFSAPTSQNVNRIRIYRTSSGLGTSAFVFVAEIPVAQASYADAVLEDTLGEALISQEWYPPPDNITGFVSHPNGFIAGFVANQFIPSEPFQPHAFDPGNVKVFDYPIVAIGVFGSTFVVATTGFTYLVNGVDPQNLTVEKLPDPYPCVSKRSMVSGDRGVIYASNEGLVWVGYGGVQVITRDVLSRDDWTTYNPRTLLGAIYDGRYIGFYRTDLAQDLTVEAPKGGGFIFDYNDRATGVEQNDKLVTLDFYVTAIYANPETNMYYVSRSTLQNRLFEWEAGTGYQPYVWQSKAFITPYITTFAAAKVSGDFPQHVDGDQPINFELLVGDEVKFQRLVRRSEPFRLPRFFRYTDPWYVRVKGDVVIYNIAVSTSIEELKEGGLQ